MKADQNDLFMLLIKLKSYLLSLMESPKDSDGKFTYTNEYLQRRFPQKREEIISLLQKNDITCDEEIAFDDKVHSKFREIVKSYEKPRNLNLMLEEFQIESDNLRRLEKVNEYNSLRDKKIIAILKILLDLSKGWALHKELESAVEVYSALEEEELIRPHEEEKLNNLDSHTLESYNNIAEITSKYLSELINYYFDFGGNEALQELIDNFDRLKKSTSKKYFDLFKSHGLKL